MIMIEVKCCVCDKPMLVTESKVKRNAVLNRKHCCSRSCIGKASNNELSPFKMHLTRIRKRMKEKDIELSLTEHDLREIWLKQEGRCSYSRVTLHHPNFRTINNKVYTASVDRIDSSIPYIKDNIQFVSIAINFMKNVMTHEEAEELCNVIYQNRKDSQT